MSLDIAAYRQIKKIECEIDEDGQPVDVTTREPIDYAFIAWKNPDFPGRADDVEDRGVYAAADSMTFSAGRYGGYNQWRDHLAKVAGCPERLITSYGIPRPSHCVDCWEGVEGPFSELINFGDSDGVIGAAVSAKLAADFARFDEQAQASTVPMFYERYRLWRAAFEMAADGGAVEFY